MSADPDKPGRVYDPVFIMMLVAVVLALASSFALRTVAGPRSVQAAPGSDAATTAQADPDGDSDANDNPIPAVIPAMSQSVFAKARAAATTNPAN